MKNFHRNSCEKVLSLYSELQTQVSTRVTPASVQNRLEKTQSFNHAEARNVYLDRQTVFHNQQQFRLEHARAQTHKS